MTEGEAALHNAILEEIKKRLRFQYKDIKINPLGEKTHEFKSFYPDMILSEQGMVLAVVEVETENSFTPDKIEAWKKLATSGARLILMVPKNLKAKITAALWDSGIATKVALGSYEININMP
jgi:hypothetical protein